MPIEGCYENYNVVHISLKYAVLLNIPKRVSKVAVLEIQQHENEDKITIQVFIK